VEARRVEREGVSAGAADPQKSGEAGGVAEAARELNIPERTARDHVKLAEDLAGHPDLAARVDAREGAAQRAF